MKFIFTISMVCVCLLQSRSQQLLKDINTSQQPGYEGSYPRDFVGLGNNVLFTAYDTISGTEVWITDGTTAGTTLLKDVNPGFDDSYPYFIDSVNGKWVFYANTANEGRELWVTDGTPNGTFILADINPGSVDGFVYNHYLGTAGGKIFVYPDNTPNGMELYATDGTIAGTYMVKDICPGNCDGLNSYDESGGEMGGKIYFASNGITGNARELWVSDGTTIGTTMVKAFGNLPHNFRQVYGTTLVFSAYTNVSGEEIWKSDGTGPGTVMPFYGDIEAGAASSDPGTFMKLGGAVCFSATTTTGGREWYYTGGNSISSQAELLPGPYGPAIAKVFDPRNALANNSYFTADDYVHGRELYAINSSTRDMQLLKDINTTGSSNPENLVYINSNTVIFTADDGITGKELWTSDGTPSGTRRLTDLNPGYHSSIWSEAFLLNGNLIFSGTRGDSKGVELYSVNYSMLLSEENLSQHTTLQVFPNPAGESFSLQFPAPVEEDTYVSLWNMVGQEIMQIPVKANQETLDNIYINTLAPGIYTGKMQNGSVWYTFRLVKA